MTTRGRTPGSVSGCIGVFDGDKTSEKEKPVANQEIRRAPVEPRGADPPRFVVSSLFALFLLFLFHHPPPRLAPPKHPSTLFLSPSPPFPARTLHLYSPWVASSPPASTTRPRPVRTTQPPSTPLPRHSRSFFPGNDEIEKQLKRDRMMAKNEIKMLLLGAGESGKVGSALLTKTPNTLTCHPVCSLLCSSR